MFITLLSLAAGLASASGFGPQIKDQNGDSVHGIDLVKAYSKVPHVALVTFEKDLATGRSSVSVYNEESSALTHYACGETIDASELGLSISFSVDDQADGLVTVNGREHSIDAEPKVTGGIACSQMYDEATAVAECVFPIKGDAAVVLPALADNSTAECFDEETEGTNLLSIRWNETDAEDDGGVIENGIVEDGEDTSLDKRQSGTYKVTLKASNLKLRKYRRHITVARHYCGNAPSCSANHAVGKTVTHGFTASVTGLPWVSAGMSVSKAWSTTNSYTCTGKKGQSVCVKHRRYYQGYDVVTMVRSLSTNALRKKYGPYQIRSPLKAAGRNGDGFYCAVNNCPSEGSVKWQDQGKGKFSGI